MARRRRFASNGAGFHANAIKGAFDKLRSRLIENFRRPSRTTTPSSGMSAPRHAETAPHRTVEQYPRDLLPRAGRPEMRRGRLLAMFAIEERFRRLHVLADHL